MPLHRGELLHECRRGEGSAGPAEAIEECKLEVAEGKELLQQMWRLFDNLDEGYVEKVVEELEKKMR
uniref:Uncharacterized protein n=1 Tax=Ignisphaera aggregans TaxID=334771 RepID=A0A7C4FCP9_9CREN